ncbi:glycoside hydrolase family 13 protein [Xylariomycetidae sp. FL2044]|nr:glycoside hydrolase family 13 protein [Xylariomycetidae sp. FL2044]
MDEKRKQPWWKEAVGYQIYPASFMDTNNDGVGDLNGITNSMDYLKALGVDFIWISPVYESPDYDMGYDISNYESIAGKYGTMEDMNRLIKEAKARGLRVLMDLVVNHTSIEHPWFKESRKSRTNHRSDWYIWRDPKYDQNGERKPPSNWRSHFGGSTWTYEPSRDQYFFHIFLPEQPELDWNNRAVREAIYTSAVDFWLEKGIDGFRVDMVNAYWKHPDFPDVPIVDSAQEHQPLDLRYVLNGPKVHEWLQEMRREVLNKYGNDIVMIGELPGTSPQEVLKYLSAKPRELDMTIDGMFFIAGNHWSSELHDMRKHSLPELKDALSLTQGLLAEAGAWTTAFLENHDVPRSVSHFGPGEGSYWRAASKLLALLNITLSGTLIIYQGQEIGMTNVSDKSWKRDDFRDRAILQYFRDIDDRFPGDRDMEERALKAAIDRGRDNCRTPMQWSGLKPYGGFTNGSSPPWIRINPNLENINVDAQLHDKDSVLSFWKAVIVLRNLHRDILVYGSFQVYDGDNKQTFSFWKTSSQRKAFVTLNMSDEEAALNLPPEIGLPGFNLLVSTLGREGEDRYVANLDPWEGRVYVSI